LQPHNVLEIGKLRQSSSLLSANMGITILPQVAVKAEIETDTLTAICWQGPAL